VELKTLPIEALIPFEKNPRGIKKKDFDRIKEQIKELGFYKPLLVCRHPTEKGKYTVLGGNKRVPALTQLGFKNVEVTIVKAETDEDKMKYVLSDNDNAGYWEDQELAEVLTAMKGRIRLEMFKVHLGEGTKLKTVLEAFGPDEQGDLGEAEVDFTHELKEEHNYVVLFFDNQIDWLQCLTLLGLKKARALHSKKGFEAMGLGRVMLGKVAIERIKG